MSDLVTEETDLAKVQRKSQRQRDAIRALESALRRTRSRLTKKGEDLESLERVLADWPDALSAWRSLRGIPTPREKARLEREGRRRAAERGEVAR